MNWAVVGRTVIERSVLVPMLSDVLMDVISPLILSMFVGASFTRLLHKISTRLIMFKFGVMHPLWG